MNTSVSTRILNIIKLAQMGSSLIQFRQLLWKLIIQAWNHKIVNDFFHVFLPWFLFVSFPYVISRYLLWLFEKKKKVDKLVK